MSAQPVSPEPVPNRRNPTPGELAILAEVIRNVCRGHRLPAVDAEDFGQMVQLRFLMRDYDVFSRFAGRSSLKTYLTVVVVRLLLDWRNAQYGKWRPSRLATRLGETAITLERLMSCRGYTADEAVAAMSNVPNADTRELARLALLLPVQRRPRIVPDTDLPEVAGDAFRDPVLSREQEAELRRVRAALRAVVDTLPSEDRDLLKVRYGRAGTIQAMSTRQATPPRQLYHRLQSILAHLRRELGHLGHIKLPSVE